MTDPSTATVRRLGQGEVAAARALNGVFAEAFEDRDTYLGEPPDDAWLEARLGDPRTVVLVAETQGCVVGGLVAYELPKLERRRSEFYIYDLAVAAGSRRRGIARALIGAVRRIAAAGDGWVIYVQADPVDDAAVALYGDLGRREDVFHFDIDPLD